tara:strand:+ start:1263 stop:1463 length:201 start_codon:yes stop_codon:yes gene_type:complete
MKKIFDVDSNGSVNDIGGEYIGICTNPANQPDANQDEKLSIKQIQALKESGLEVDEIIKLKNSGVI